MNLVLTDAVKRGASDIHMEPYEKEFRVRFRIDGMLQTIMTPPLKLKDAITSRIKIMAKLDISEKRLPQDGRIMMKMQAGRQEEAAGLPRQHAADTVGRKNRDALAGQGEPAAGHDQAGLRAGVAGKFENAILKPYGMVLVTGPTGSGKTNTLYSSISRLNKPTPTS